MESEQEIHSTFSKLNVNAVEFVPNFGSFGGNAAEPESTVEEVAKPDVVMSENNGNGESRQRNFFLVRPREKFATSNVVKK